LFHKTPVMAPKQTAANFFGGAFGLIQRFIMPDGQSAFEGPRDSPQRQGCMKTVKFGAAARQPRNK
jgi:hypothetical protein